MRYVLALLFTICSVPLAAQDFDAFGAAGSHGFMRHALAPGTSDPANFDVHNCDTQRNLDDRGRAQAVAIGQAMRAAGVQFDQVWSSQWCRSRDTAVLMDMGPVIEVPALNSFFENRSRADAQTEALRARLDALPEGTKVLMVSHMVNVRALTGTTTASGEIVVLAPDTLEVLDQILIDP